MPKKKNYDLDKNIVELIDHKLNFYTNLCQKTLIHVEKNKLQDIMGVSELNQCVDYLTKINNKILLIKHSVDNNCNKEYLLTELQSLNNEFASLIKKYGANDLYDLILDLNISVTNSSLVGPYNISLFWRSFILNISSP